MNYGYAFDRERGRERETERERGREREGEHHMDGRSEMLVLIWGGGGAGREGWRESGVIFMDGSTL
eukprot:4913556-Pyramimonas_sp.AAC.1